MSVYLKFECRRNIYKGATVTCNGGMAVSLFYQQVPWTLWKPWQQHQLDRGGKHDQGQEQRPVFFLWGGKALTKKTNLWKSYQLYYVLSNGTAHPVQLQIIDSPFHPLSCFPPMLPSLMRDKTDGCLNAIEVVPFPAAQRVPGPERWRRQDKYEYWEWGPGSLACSWGRFRRGTSAPHWDKYLRVKNNYHVHNCVFN